MLSNEDKKFFKLTVTDIGKDNDIDIAARCPVCGDSTTNKRSKRLHLYTKGTVTNVNCFNGGCPCENKTVYSYLRDFFPELLGAYKKENFKNTMKTLAGESDSKDVFSGMSKPVDNWDSVIETVKPVTTQDLSPYMTPIDGTPAITYLNNRGIPYDKEFGLWYYGNQDLKIGEITYPIKNSVIIPLYFDNEMYGFYSRSIKDKMFCTYNNEMNIGFKVWNWFKVDKTKPVYIFEGIFDAISSGLTNIIALMGAKLPDDRLNELSHPVFCLDNDKTGFLNSIKYANLGKMVFVQPNELKEKDMNELKLNHNINIPELIKGNLYSGISAVVRIKSRL